MIAYDLFSEIAHSGASFTHTRTSGTTSGDTTLNPEGSAFTLASPPATPFTVGMRVFVLDASFKLAFCVVKKVTSTTNITLLPIQSATDNVTLPYLFASGSSILNASEVAAQQVIDLSEAPDDAYDYLVIGCGDVESSGSPGVTDISLRLGALQDDVFSGTVDYGAAKVSLSAANPDRMNFVAATKLSLVGGQRYDNYILFAGPNTDGVSTLVRAARILAIRVTGGYFAGDGLTAAGNTTSTSYQDYLDLGANIPAGQYLIVSTWALGSTTGSAYADAVLEADGSTVLANQVTQVAATTNYIPGGFMGVVTLGGTNRVRLRYKSVGGANANIRNAFLAAVPIGSIPAFAAVHVDQDLSTNYSASVGTTFTAAKTSGSVTLESGRHIEIVSASVGGNAALRSRPNYGAAGSGNGANNIPPFGTASDAYHPTFWFVRNRRDAGSTTNAVEVRSQSGTNTLKARDFTFSWLREQPDFRAQPDEPIAVVADVEMGGRPYKSWNSTTTTRRYSHRISDYTMMSRVLVNGTAYTRVYALSDLSDGEWFWDATAYDLYVQLTTGDAAIGEPSSNALHVVVTPLLLIGLQKHDLIDAMGTPWRYRPLISEVPTTTQTLRSQGARFSTASQLGSLDVAMAHGEFDDKLFRSSFESYRAKVRRGFPRKSDRLEDFEVVADATIGGPQSDFESMTIRLLDRRRLLQAPVANTRVTVREGYGTDARSRENQEMPVVWGETLGLVAYRITANEGGTDWNEYQFCDHGVKAVSAVWVDTERRKRAVGTGGDTGKLDTSTTYSDVGKIRIRNDNSAIATATQPPDVVYVDIIGRSSNGTTTGTAYQTLGAIARDLVVTYGGTPASRLIEKTFRMADRRWRWQQLDAGGRRPVAPRLSLVVSGKTSVEQALTKLCGDANAYWIVNHQDRVGLDVPDFERGQMVRNPGLEDDTDSPYPWAAFNSATLAITVARKYEGAQSAEISNGSPANASAYAAQNVPLAAGEIHAVTLVASLLEGVADSFRIGIVGPSGVETLSEAITLETGRWTRCNVVYESEPGDAGHTELRLYPAYGSTTATTVAVDNIEMYRVACVTDRVNSTPRSIDWEEEHYFECTVPHSVNRAGNQAQIAKRNVGEAEARGLSAALQPEGKFAIQSSTRAELSDTRAADSESAGGIAASVALQYSRRRPVLTIDVTGLERLPVVGDYVFHQNNPRIPEQADNYPIWRIAEVAYGKEDGKLVELKLRQRIDPIIDRVEISPDNIPMGAGAFTLSGSAITDYDEVTALQGQFLMVADTPDLSTQRGDLYHKHSLSHVHALPSHLHAVTLASHGIDAAGEPYWHPWPIEHVGKYEYPSPIGPQAPTRSTRGLADGGHSHSVPGTPANVATASGTSSTPNSAIETSPGPNEPSYRRVRVMQRVENTEALISADLIVGFRTASLPAGWTRTTALDGVYLRGATANGAVSTTVATSTFTPTDAGSTLNVASGTGISVGKRLRIRRTNDGNKQVHVVVTAGSGTAWTVVPLHETTDEANTYTFPAGASSTVVGDSEAVNQAYTAPTHKHGGLMPSHAHAAGGHAHATGAAVWLLGPASEGIDVQKYISGSFFELAANDEHQHTVTIDLPAANDNSASASGSLTGDVAPSPGFFELVWAVSDGNQRTIPAGGVLPWLQSDVAPGGWAKIGEAVGLLLKGAATGIGPTAGVGGHAHTQSNTAHTLPTHNHGGSVILPSSAPSTGQGPIEIAENSSANFIAVAVGPYEAYSPPSGGHAHAVTATVASTDPGLSAGSHATAAELLGVPRHKQIVLIQKQ